MILLVNKTQRKALEYLFLQLRRDEAAQKKKIGETLKQRNTARGRLNHTLRVLENVRMIMKEVSCDKEVVEMAAILHDIAKLSNDRQHGKKGAEIASLYLERQGFSKKFVEKVAECIRLHSQKGETQKASIEAKILQDADLLEHHIILEIHQLIKEAASGNLLSQHTLKQYKELYPQHFVKKCAAKGNFLIVREKFEKLILEIDRTIIHMKEQGKEKKKENYG